MAVLGYDPKWKGWNKGWGIDDSISNTQIYWVAWFLDGNARHGSQIARYGQKFM